MSKFSHAGLVAFSGVLWLAIGLFLMPLGLKLLYGIIEVAGPVADYPLIQLLSPYAEVDTAAVFLIAAGLVIGSMKVKYVLSKTIHKVIVRILSLPEPSPVTSVYGMKYIYLMAVMISLGMAMKYFNIPLDVRGVIDVAVGSALMTGGLTFLRVAYDLRSRVEAEKGL